MKFLDQTGRELRFEETPTRVVSLVPSITELAYDLGFEVIGKTKFCVHPKSINSAIIVGGTKDVKVGLVKSLKPDLVLANKEENTQSIVEELLTAGIPVFVSDVSTVAQSLDLIEKLGQIGEFNEQAIELSNKITQGFSSIPSIQTSPKALYLIWQKPYMAAGTDTYISDLMSHLGIINVMADWNEAGLRYPEISTEEIKKLDLDFIFLSSEPYPFKKKHQDLITDEFHTPTLLVDGEAFSWYGSRQAKSLDYLKEFSRLLNT